MGMNVNAARQYLFLAKKIEKRGNLYLKRLHNWLKTQKEKDERTDEMKCSKCFLQDDVSR